MRKPKKFTLEELTRLAFIYAEQDRQAMVSAWPEGTPEHEYAMCEFAQLRAYRMKRWGKTQFESDTEGLKSIPIKEIKGR